MIRVNASTFIQKYVFPKTTFNHLPSNIKLQCSINNPPSASFCPSRQTLFFLLILSKSRINIIISPEKTTNKQMASLRNAFMQTYHSNNPCFNFLSTLPGVITSLLNTNDLSNPEDKEPFSRKLTKVSYSFQKIERIFKSDQDRLLWISTFYKKSLHQIMDSNSSDFQAEKQDSTFVHALEVINDRDLQDNTFDMRTVQSQVISLVGNDPNSTDNSVTEDFDVSDVVDI